MGAQNFVDTPNITAGKPSTSKTLAMLEPITLPKASEADPSRAALIDMINSGAEVPKATIVKLTIKAGTPSFKLNPTAPRTKASPATINMAKPLKTYMISKLYRPIYFLHEQGFFPILYAPHVMHFFAVSSEPFFLRF